MELHTDEARRLARQLSSDPNARSLARLLISSEQARDVAAMVIDLCDRLDAEVA